MLVVVIMIDMFVAFVDAVGEYLFTYPVNKMSNQVTHFVYLMSYTSHLILTRGKLMTAKWWMSKWRMTI